MPTDKRVIDVINQVEQTPQLDESSVARLFGVRLQPSNDRSNPYVNVFFATVVEPSPVSELELRVSVDKSRRGQALLILTLRSNLTVTVGDLSAHLGPPSNIESPRATAPHGTPTYEVRDLPWGRLSLGYLPAENDVVRKVIFDRKAL